jgi:hypothetical protein
MSSLKEIKNMALGNGGRHDWRLRTLSEERELSANKQMVEGTDAFHQAFDKLEAGDQEGALAALKRAVQSATGAIEAIKG